MNDVARHAGVSQATVSLVLNNVEGSRVSAETRTRVNDAVRALGYRRNSTAKALREGKARLIGFVGDTVASAPFAGEIIEGAQEQAWAAEHLMLIANTGADPGLEQRAIDSLLSRQVDGIAYVAMYHRLLDVPDALREVPCVIVNAEAADASLPAVVPDEYRGGLEATEHLIQHGHHRIGFININTLESGLPAAVDRERGFVDAHHRAGIDVNSDLIHRGFGEVEDGYAGASAMLASRDRPTAIFAGNDRTAWGVYQAAAEFGLRIPDDLSVVGFDNQTLIAEHLKPGLTTMALPFAEMGRRGVSRLLAGERRPVVERLQCQLVTRRSVAALDDTRTAGRR